MIQNKTVIERVKLIINDLGVTNQAFEQTLGVSNGYVNTMAKRGSAPSVDFIIKIRRAFPGYSLTWLLLGEGPMQSQRIPQGAKDPLNAINKDLEEIKGQNLNIVKKLSVVEELAQDIKGIQEQVETINILELVKARKEEN